MVDIVLISFNVFMYKRIDGQLRERATVVFKQPRVCFITSIYAHLNGVLIQTLAITILRGMYCTVSGALTSCHPTVRVGSQ